MRVQDTPDLHYRQIRPQPIRASATVPRKASGALPYWLGRSPEAASGTRVYVDIHVLRSVRPVLNQRVCRHIFTECGRALFFSHGMDLEATLSSLLTSPNSDRQNGPHSATASASPSSVCLMCTPPSRRTRSLSSLLSARYRLLMTGPSGRVITTYERRVCTT